MIARLWESSRDRLVGSDPGYTRLRLGLSAVLGIAVAIAALTTIGLPLPIMLVAAIAAMMTAFTVNDPKPGQQAITLVCALGAGACALAAASYGEAVPPADIVVFVLLIFVAVYSQRFGSRGIALGSVSFFLFFFAMFLQIKPHQLPTVLLALTVGIASNALVRFVLLPRRKRSEFLRLQKAFRARLGAVVRACEGYLASYGSQRSRKQLKRANSRLHEAVLLVDDAAPDVVEGKDADTLRRRSIEVELAVQWLSMTTQRTCAQDLRPEVREELIAALQRFHSLIERDPAELPLISETGEFSKMLLDGSKIDGEPEVGDQLRLAIAELAVADVKAQRVITPSGFPEPTEPEAEESGKTSFFVYDNQTRSAIQAVIGGGLAVLGGQLVSQQRWYWAVLTVFVVFLGTASAGATFVKGARRLAGTLIGIFGGVLLALLVGSNKPATLALLMVCIFGMVYMSRISQFVMAFFATSMLGLLYSLLGTFTIHVLWIRLAETAVGAAAGILAAIVIMPVRTRAVMLNDITAVLGDLHEFLDQTTKLLAGVENVNIIELSRDLDHTVEQVRRTVEPLTHPINVSNARRDYGWYVLTTLETIAFRARHVAARSQPGALAGEERLGMFTDRIIANIDVLTYALGSLGKTGHGELVLDDGTPVSDHVSDPQARSVLSSLGQLDNAVIALGRAFDLEAVTPKHAPAPAS
jgi:uncharacterized membrane protein YccC